MIIDTHCHLISEKYGDLDQLREESLALGVGHCVSQGTSAYDWEPQLALAARMPDFVSSCLAVHPSEVHMVSDEQLEHMVQLCHQHPQAAIGETGLDYFWEAPEGWSEDAYRARQRHFLERHFQLARSRGSTSHCTPATRKGLPALRTPLP